MIDAIQILADLKRHETLFDLSKDGLGNQLLNVAANEIETMFIRHKKPDGSYWAPLTSDYARWKRLNFPGEPMGVLTGGMSSEFPGETQVQPDLAQLTALQSAAMRARLGSFSERRPFFGFNEESITVTTSVLDNHFKENV